MGEPFMHPKGWTRHDLYRAPYPAVLPGRPNRTRTCVAMQSKGVACSGYRGADLVRVAPCRVAAVAAIGGAGAGEDTAENPAPMPPLFPNTTLFRSVWRCNRKGLLVVGIVGLILCGWPPVEWLLSRPLEARYPVRPFRATPGLQAISSRKSLCALKKNETRGAKAPPAGPAAIAASM